MLKSHFSEGHPALNLCRKLQMSICKAVSRSSSGKVHWNVVRVDSPWAWRALCGAFVPGVFFLQEKVELWPKIPVISTCNPIYRMSNSIYNQLYLINGHNCRECCCSMHRHFSPPHEPSSVPWLPLSFHDTRFYYLWRNYIVQSPIRQPLPRVLEHCSHGDLMQNVTYVLAGSHLKNHVGQPTTE